MAKESAWEMAEIEIKGCLMDGEGYQERLDY